MAPVSEVSLANGRRADVAAVADSGEIWIVEIKSSIEDFRTDQKWPEYRDYLRPPVLCRGAGVPAARSCPPIPA